jgi:hypothetical protein
MRRKRKDPQEGQTFVSSGGATYTYTKTESGGMEWQRFGGELPAVEVTAESSGSSYSPVMAAADGFAQCGRFECRGEHQNAF